MCNEFRGLACFAVALLASLPTQANIYVNGGVDSTVAPSLTAELQVVYAGQQFTAATVNSLAAASGFINNDCTFGILPDCSWSPLGAATTVDFAVSLIPLSSGQLSAYASGLGMTEGPLLQFPLYGVPITIALHAPGITANGQLILDDGALCGIFSGQLTDWSQFSNSVPPGGFSIVYDQSNGSGATWLLTQHLNAVCNATNSAFTTLPVPVTSSFASLPVPGGVASNPRFLAAGGASAMQSALLGNSSALSYLGPSYTEIAPSSPVTANLPVAALVNRLSGVITLPTAGSTSAGLQNFGPHATDTVAPATMSQAANPANWVPQNPMPSKGYPIVGFANWILSQCYASVGRELAQYLSQPFSPTTHNSIIAANGLARLGQALPAFGKAVAADLTGNKNNYGLNLQNPLACLAYPGR